VWTAAEEARLGLRLTDSAAAHVELVLDVVPLVTGERAAIEFEICGPVSASRRRQSVTASHLSLPYSGA
jgi:hypothetical protein